MTRQFPIHANYAFLVYVLSQFIRMESLICLWAIDHLNITMAARQRLWPILMHSTFLFHPADERSTSYDIFHSFEWIFYPLVIKSCMAPPIFNQLVMATVHGLSMFYHNL